MVIKFLLSLCKRDAVNFTATLFPFRFAQTLGYYGNKGPKGTYCR